MIPAADLFAGGTGWSTGASQTGRVRVLWAANHWPAAVACGRLNHPGTAFVCQDLMQADWRALPDLSDGLLIASPACQGFSSSGKPGNHGRGASVKHQADRNTSWAVLAACDTARPRRVLVETVPGFLSWELFPCWRATLEAMGYRIACQTFDAADFGVPQERRRMILAAELDADPADIRPTGERATLADAHDVDATGWQPIAGKSESIRRRMRAAQERNGAGVSFWANVDSSRGRRLDECAPTMTTRSAGQWYWLRGDECRGFTVPELARVQTFPESHRWPDGRTLAGHMLGNAVPPRMARAIVAQVVAS